MSVTGQNVFNLRSRLVVGREGSRGVIAWERERFYMRVSILGLLHDGGLLEKPWTGESS